MRAIHTFITACLVFSQQVFLNYDSPFEVPALSEAKGGQGDVNTKKPIKIGLLIQNKNSVAAKNGAELAIINANSGSDKGIKFELVVRSMEGPWGTGSKQAVDLVFDEEVVAMIGSHDGRNAHLVEQVSAKSGVVFLSAWSGDPTLAQAFVPWFFNCVYNDHQQSDALIEEIYIKRTLRKIAVISDNGYDSGSMLKNFLKRVESEGKPEPMQFVYSGDSQELIDIPQKLKRADIECIILFVQPPASLKIAEQLRVNNMDQPVFCSLAQLDENEIPGQDLKFYENYMFVSSENFGGKQGIFFSEEYLKKHGTYPGAVAACAFDGMNILIESIRNAGTEREKLQKYIADINYEGVTGNIQFDDKGNRKGVPGFVKIKNGFPVPMK